MLAIQVLRQMMLQMGTLLYAPVFWLAVALVYLQMRQQVRKKEELFQLRREPLAGKVVLVVVAGVAAGLLASLILLVLGVTVDCIGLEYVWMVALLLLLVRQRFLCFAYSGGVLATANCLWGYPVLDGAQLLTVVAVLHCAEAFLVWSTGHLNRLPLYLQDQNRQITGGFLLQMVWPLPLLMLWLLSGDTLPQAGFLLLPDWWPVLGAGQAQYAALYVLLPVLAALGYSDVAVCHSVRRKTTGTAVLLLCYSAMLLLLVLATRQGTALLLPALFAPLGHEAMIWYGRRQELRGNSRFCGPERGLLILDVQAGSPAARAGLRSEDWIFALDGQPVENRQQFLQQQYRLPPCVTVTYLRRGKRRQCRMRMGRWSQPGIIPAPDRHGMVYWELQPDQGLIKFLHKKLAKTLKKNT